MFQLPAEEAEQLRRQIGTSSCGGRRYLPYVSILEGVAMLASVIHASSSIQQNALFFLLDNLNNLGKLFHMVMTIIDQLLAGLDHAGKGEDHIQHINPDTKRMARQRRQGGAAGFTLLELTVVIVVIGILASLGYESMDSYNRLQKGIAAANDLREIYLAQKKAIVLGLSRPTTLDYPGAWTTVPALVANRLLPASATAAYPNPPYDCSTIPPTHYLDGPAGNNSAKTIGQAHTGDGLYDIGPED